MTDIEAVATDVDQPEEAPTVTQPDAVVIHRIEEDGQIRTVVQPVGDVRVTEVQTLMELGLQAWREQIGLPK